MKRLCHQASSFYKNIVWPQRLIFFLLFLFWFADCPTEPKQKQKLGNPVALVDPRLKDPNLEDGPIKSERKATDSPGLILKIVNTTQSQSPKERRPASSPEKSEQIPFDDAWLFDKTKHPFLKSILGPEGHKIGIEFENPVQISRVRISNPERRSNPMDKGDLKPTCLQLVWLASEKNHHQTDIIYLNGSAYQREFPVAGIAGPSIQIHISTACPPGLKTLATAQIEIYGTHQDGGLPKTKEYVTISAFRSDQTTETIRLDSSATGLSITGNGLVRIDRLAQLKNLKRLILWQNRIADLSFLKGLFKLTHLDVGANSIRTMTHIPELPNLKNLTLDYNKITQLSGLQNLSALSTLTIQGNQIQKIEGLEKMSQLKWLNFSDNQIRVIEGLDSLVNLHRLRLSRNRIGRITGLNQLIHLYALDLDENRIERIEGLEKLASLTNLDLAKNTISRIEGLNQLSQLTSLHLNNNRIYRIEGFHKLLHLKNLNLVNNKIQGIEGLDTLKSLKTLSLQNNQIQKIEGLPQDRPLILNLSGNKISAAAREKAKVQYRNIRLIF